MAGYNKRPSDQKRGFPGGFLLLLLGGILVFLTLQNLSDDKAGKVAFSHQAEHLVNLDLLQKDESRKVALNDNLVTFQGRFRESLTDDAKARYRYLELLAENHELIAAKERLTRELSALQKNVIASSERFLALSGIEVPKEGYAVVSPSFDTHERDNGIVIKSAPESRGMNLPEVEALVDGNADPARIQSELDHLIQGFKSSSLGIGNETMKNQLRQIEKEVQGASGSPQEKLATYSKALLTLREIVATLNLERNHVRLIELRSVRNYMVDLEQYNEVLEGLDTNVAQLTKSRRSVSNVTWFFNNKELSTRALERQDAEEYSRWFAATKQEWSAFAQNRGSTFKAPDQPRNTVLERTFKSEEPSPNYFSYILTFLPILLVVLLLYFVFSRQMKGGGMGGGAMNFGKSPARMLNKAQNKVTFSDVAGVEEAKEELEEVVDFLKDPTRYTALGARIPKGVLLIGPPGTGKTLTAKAVAGEADRPFFSISGSDFVEMFVGVGASRIRDLFEQAKKQAPCIVFIDEIDAVGRHRGAGIGGGHDEREQTLNQLLVEMDGFDTNEGVILMAATNRPDVLDKALLRPGRFDRQVMLDLPDIKGRHDILKVHARKIKLDSSVELMKLARGTAGCSGADLMNILNEAALIAARKGRTAVTENDALEACDKVRYGKERRSLELTENEKKNTAYHESGHAIVGLVVEHGDPVEKVTIVPRGMSLGATHFVPERNKVSYWRKELKDRLAVLMGGRIAEDIFLGDVSSGAQMDIAQATKLARSMVCEWGMTDALGAVAYEDNISGGGQGMPGQHTQTYSPETAQTIDGEVRKILDEANEMATQIINDNRDKVELMAQMLLEFEILDKEDVHAIIDGTWNTEEKRKRVQVEIDAHRKEPPPPPPPLREGKSKGIDPNPRPQGI